MKLKQVKLKDIVKVGAGQSAPKKIDNDVNGLTFIRAGSVEKLIQTDDTSFLERVSLEQAKENKLKIYEKDTVVFAKSGISATLNRVYMLKEKSYVVSHLATLIPINIYPKYLLYALRYFSPTVLIKDFAYPSISLKAIENHLIIIPERYEDQEKIANLLSQIETLNIKREKTIVLLDKLVKSTFLDMFGDPITNSKGWEKRKLGEIFKIKHGYAFKSEYFKESGKYLLLTPGNFFEKGGFRERGKLQKYYVGDIPQEYILRKNDLLVAMTEQTAGLLGSSLLVPSSDKYLHNQRLGLVSPTEEIQVMFLLHLFNQDSIRKIIHAKARGMKVRHTSPSKIEDICIGYPPKDLQDKFANIVIKIESTKKIYQNSLDELHQLFSSVSQKAFKGELDFEEDESELDNYLAELYRKYKKNEEKVFIAKQMDVNNISLPQSSNIESQKSFTKNSLIEDILEQLKPKGLTFAQLSQYFKDNNYYDIPYDGKLDDMKIEINIKDIIFQLLKEEKLFQIFDRETKQILLGVKKCDLDV